MHWGLYRATQEHGVRVLFDGLDGDTAVSHGLKQLAALAYRGKFLALRSELGPLASRNGKNPDRLWREYVWRYGVKPRVPPGILRSWQRWRGRDPDERERVLNPDWARTLSLDDDRAPEAGVGRAWRTERQHHAHSLSRGVISLALEVADHAAAFGLEPRYPFFDKRLVEFCLGLPPNQKLRDGWTRWILRQSLEGVLPTEIQWRVGKSNLAPNFAHGLFTYDRARIEGALQRAAGAASQYLNLPYLQAVYGRNLATRSPADELTLWRTLTFSEWLCYTRITL